MTRKKAVDVFRASLEHAFNEGYKQYAKSESDKIIKSNERLRRALSVQMGADFVQHLSKFQAAVKAKGAFLRVVRQPVGVPVMDRRLVPAQHVWFENRNHEFGNYTIISIQLKPGRWLQSNAHH